jgi:tRNA threonylcarbamoyladenosine modification (KEOPS) complex  Pcc1 subunit
MYAKSELKKNRKVKTMRARTEIEVICDSPESAKSSLDALGKGIVSGRAKINAKIDGKRLWISIDAQDIVAFRAAANSALRDLQVFEGIERDIE